MEVVRWCGSLPAAKRLATLLRGCGIGSLLVGDGVISPDRRVDVLLLCGDLSLEREQPSLLVLTGQGCAGPQPALLAGRIKLAIVEGSDLASLGSLAGSGIPAVTVGFSERDSISYSSLTEGGCSVVVNRPFETAGGGLLLEQEIPLSCPSPGVEELFLVAAALYLGAPPEQLSSSRTGLNSQV